MAKPERGDGVSGQEGQEDEGGPDGRSGEDGVAAAAAVVVAAVVVVVAVRAKLVSGLSRPRQVSRVEEEDGLAEGYGGPHGVGGGAPQRRGPGISQVT